MQGIIAYFIVLLKRLNTHLMFCFQPIKSSPGGARNPFRKKQESAKNAPSPLSLTERTLVEVHSTDAVENKDVSNQNLIFFKFVKLKKKKLLNSDILHIYIMSKPEFNLTLSVGFDKVDKPQ